MACDIGNLVRQAQRGDLDAYGNLVTQFWTVAFCYAHGVLRDFHLAEDAVQEAFVEAYRDLPKLREPDAFPGWLRRIVYKYCDRITRRKRVDTIPLDCAHEAPSTSASPDETAIRKEILERVLAAVRALPKRERVVSEMFYVHGHSQKEIAGILHVPLSTVNSRLHASRKRLRAQLAGSGERSHIARLSRSKEGRGWRPDVYMEKEPDMTLHYEQKRRALLKGDVEVLIRTMTREDIPALRRFDDEVQRQLDEANAHRAPGAENWPGGPWSKDEWLTAHFDRCAARGNITLLAEDLVGKVVGFADLWVAREPEPFWLSLDVECIDYLWEYYGWGIETVLLEEAERVARAAGLPAVDIGSNTVSGHYASLRRFGMKPFYEYDHAVCRCVPVALGERLTSKRVRPHEADLSGLIKVSHWSPTDFTWREDSERAWISEIAWEGHRAMLELWTYDPQTDGSLPVPEVPPERSELYAEPDVLSSSKSMSALLRECACLAGEAGANEIELPCPSSLALDPGFLDVVKREFAFAWFRKQIV